MSDKLSIISIIISGLVLALSIINTIARVREKKQRPMVDAAKIAIPYDDLFFMDMVLVNKSIAPLSIISCDIEYNGRVVASSDIYELFTMYHKNDQRIVRIATEIPFQVLPYSAKRAVLQFPVQQRNKLFRNTLLMDQTRQTSSNEKRNQKHRIVRLHLHTSRGHHTVDCRVSLIDAEKWMREYSSYNFILH